MMTRAASRPQLSVRAKQECHRSPTPTPVRRSPSRARLSPTRRSGAPPDLKSRLDPLRECALPSCVVPSYADRPQALASQHAFAATAGGSVACLSGGCAVECHSDRSQALRSGPRARPLACCALSPCGRYLAAGEAGGSAGSSGPCPQVLVFDRAKGGNPTVLRGHVHGVMLVAWFKKSSLLLSVSDGERSNCDHQLLLWSWPQAERLAAAVCPWGVVDIALAPDSFAFVTVGASAVKRWSIAHPQGEFSAARSRSAALVAGRPLPTGFLGRPGCEGEGAQQADDAFISAAWGAASALYILTKHGSLCAVDVEDRAADRSLDLGRCAHALVWAERLCGERPSAGGLLACALEMGYVQILDADQLRSMAMLRPNAAYASMEAIGVSYSVGGEALWVLYSDRSLARWRHLGGEPDRMLPAPLPGLQACTSIPGTCLPQLITSSKVGLQLWAAPPAEELRLEVQERGGREARAAAGELTALACSPWFVACGHQGGELRLAALPSLEPAEPLPHRHSGDVLALSFSAWQPESGTPLLLASASRDRSVVVFSIEPEDGSSSLLLQLSGHPAAVHGVALLGGAGAGALHLAACLADRSLALRELELGPGGASVRRMTRQPSRGGEWVGLCAHPAKAVLYAACSERRVLQLDASGRACQQLRVGGCDSELRAPVRLSGDGRLLAVGLAAAPRSACGGASGPPAVGLGVLLLEAEPSLRPLSCLVGHSEPVRGLAFLQGDRLLGWGKEGPALLWDAPPPQAEARRGEEGPGRAASPAARAGSPAAPGRGRPGPAGREGPAAARAGAGHDGPASPQRPRAGPGCSSAQRGRGAASSSSPRPRARGAGNTIQSTQSARLRAQRCSRNDAPFQYEGPTRDSRCSRVESHRGKDGILKKILASSPKPPKWAGSSIDSSLGSGGLAPSLLAECSGTACRRHGTLLLGKWARGSRVGEQVLSASDLHAALASEELLACAPPLAEAAPRAAAASRSPSRGPDGAPLRPLPPKPPFPPPAPQEPGLPRPAGSAAPSEAPLSTRVLTASPGQASLCTPESGFRSMCDLTLPGTTLLGVATPCRALCGGDGASLSTADHVAALAAELRARAAAPVLESLARELLASSGAPSEADAGASAPCAASAAPSPG